MPVVTRPRDVDSPHSGSGLRGVREPPPKKTYLDDPTRVIGRLREPLLRPQPDEREGYVPNVLYSCGALVHGPNLVLPYAISDTSTRFAIVPLADLLAEILRG